jgi:hypothetical protein
MVGVTHQTRNVRLLDDRVDPGVGFGRNVH